MNDQRAERIGPPGTDAPSHDSVPAGAGDTAARPINAEAVLAGISGGVIALDNAWRIVHANPAALRMWGRDIGALLGKPIEAALDINPDNPFRAIYLASKNNDEPVAFNGYSGNPRLLGGHPRLSDGGWLHHHVSPREGEPAQPCVHPST